MALGRAVRMVPFDHVARRRAQRLERVEQSGRLARGLSSGVSDVPLRLAMVGCGAIAEQGHLPAMLDRGLSPACFVDPEFGRARSMSERFGGIAATDWEEVSNDFTAAIVAVPHNMHQLVGAGLLAAGKHVLMEKPLALTSAECDSIVAAASQGCAFLGVGHMRRQMVNSGVVRELVRDGVLGRIHTVRIEEGSVDRWDAASDGQIRRRVAGGGVLIGVGVHSLDLLRWWFGPITPIAYADDSRGGVEANCVLWAETDEGVPIRCEFSRTRNLSNVAEIVSDRGVVRVDLHGSGAALPGRVRASRPQLLRRSRLRGATDFRGQFLCQIDDFVNGIRGQEVPRLASGREASDTVRVVESAYGMAKQLVEPWAAQASAGGM